MAAHAGSIEDDLTASDEVKSKPGPGARCVESVEKSPSRDFMGDTEPLVANGRGDQQPHHHQGRPGELELHSMVSLSLSVSRQFSSGSLSATLGVNGKTCDVNLSEEKMVWTNKKGEDKKCIIIVFGGEEGVATGMHAYLCSMYI